MEADPPRGTPRATHATGRGVALPAFLVGVGLGGLFDGIVFHQILQWHHMLSSQGNHPASTLEGLESNTLWDGLFHAAAYATLTAGLILMARRPRAQTSTGSSRILVGWMLTGWGLFDLAEGIVDHHILQIHHVRSGPGQLAWDLSFLALGAVLVLVGQLLVRSVDRERPSGTKRQA